MFKCVFSCCSFLIGINYGYYQGFRGNTTPSSLSTAAALSQNRPVVMPESCIAQDSEERNSWLAHLEDYAAINR